MKSIGRSIKCVIGWALALFFGILAVYAMFDESVYDLGMILVCLILAAAGGVLIVSAARDKRKAEAIAEEERACRRALRQDAVPFVTVECPGCGAVAKVRQGGSVRCEYCGTPLGRRQK